MVGLNSSRLQAVFLIVHFFFPFNFQPICIPNVPFYFADAKIHLFSVKKNLFSYKIRKVLIIYIITWDSNVFK